MGMESRTADRVESPLVFDVLHNHYRPIVRVSLSNNLMLLMGRARGLITAIIEFTMDADRTPQQRNTSGDPPGQSNKVEWGA